MTSMLTLMATVMMMEWLVVFFCATHPPTGITFSGDPRRKLYSEYITEHNAEYGADVASAKKYSLPIDPSKGLLTQEGFNTTNKRPWFKSALPGFFSPKFYKVILKQCARSLDQNRSLNRLPQKRHRHICLTFLHCVFSNATSNDDCDEGEIIRCK